MKSLALSALQVSKTMKDAAPGMTKKSQETNMASLRSLGQNVTHTLEILHGQGFGLQRRIRLVGEVTDSVDKHYNTLHTGNRDPLGSRKHYGDMASPQGLKHILDIFGHLSEVSTQAKLGLLTSEDELPFKASVEHLTMILEDDSNFLGEVMAFACPLAGLLLRRVLWHQEGLPGSPTSIYYSHPSSPRPADSRKSK